MAIFTYWREVSKCDKYAIAFVQPHYSIATPNAKELGPPGVKLVLMGRDGKAVWGSHMPAPWSEATRADKFDGYSCFIFRNDGGPQSSGIIRQAVAITAIEWDGIVCGHRGFITYVAVNKVRRKRDPGRCFIKAGFKYIRIKEKTKHGPMARFEMTQDVVRECVQQFLIGSTAT